MLYMILVTDSDNTLALRQQYHDEHLHRLKQLEMQNRLVLVGSNPLLEENGFSGSLLVAEFESIESVEQWISEDPYAYAGVYEEVLIRPFQKVLPE